MVAAVALFAAVSCNKELPQEENLPTVGETVVYTASTDAADTKAVLNETTKKSEWAANDAITVLDGTKDWTFTTANAGANVDFSNSEGFGEYRPVLAVYPAAGEGVTYTANVAAKTAKAYIPTWQQAQAGTYHSPAALAVAYSEDNTFAFKNAHALLKFTVNTDNVTHVIFHGNGSEPEAITGDVYVTLGEDGVESVECLETEFTEKQWNEETQQNEDVKVNKYGTWVECYATDGTYFEKNKTYYVAVAPQTFESGITVKFRVNKGGEFQVKTTDKEVVTRINTILNLGKLEYTAPETVKTVYLKPGVWDTASAWYNAHFYSPLGDVYDVTMTDADGDGLFEAAVPDGVDKVIFCRMNPNYDKFSWNSDTEKDHVWNQSSEEILPLSGSEQVYYMITGWSSAKWGSLKDAEVPAVWGLAGGFNGWKCEDETYHMTRGADGWYEITGVKILSTEEFKFVTENSWDNSLGATSSGFKAQSDVEYECGDKNIGVSTEGVYTIRLQPVAKKFKIIRTGDIPINAEGTWSLVGTINNWNNADKTYTMSTEGIWFVYRNLEVSAAAEIKLVESYLWDINRGGSWVGIDKPIEVGQDGTNIKVPVGTYDVYMNGKKTQVYFMTPGKVPTI